MLSAHQRNKDARTKRSHSSMQDDFFRLCFDGTISYPPLDTSEFPSDELSDSFLNTITEQNYVATNGPLKDVKGIIWHLRPYLIDLINRRLPLDTVHEKFQRHITEFQFSSRDLMVALLESIDVDLKSMLLSDIAAANRPIPILLNSKYAKMGLSIIASLPYIPKSGLILSIGFSHFGVKSSCKCDKRSLLQGLFPTRGCNFHKWNSTDLCHDDSMDVLFCRDGNFEKLPVTIVDAHINPNSAIPQHYKSLLKNFATNAFAVVISICDFDVKKVETILNLIGENSVTPKIIVFNPTVEITQFEYDELTDDDWVSLDDRKEIVESFLEHRADFKVFRVLDSPVVGLIQSHLNLEVSSMYNQLVENMLMGDEEHLLKVTWSSVLGACEISSDMPVDDTLQYIMTNFENLMTDFVATYQTQFPLGKVDDEIWELRTLLDGKISATSGRWNNSNDVWLALEKLEVDYVNCRHEKSLDLLRLFAVVLTKKSLTLLRQFRYLIATKLQPLVFASDKDAFVDISNFWRELILASKLRIKDRRDIDEIDDACFLLFEEYGLTKQDLEDSFLLWTLAGEPVQFVLSNNRTLDNEFVAGIFQSIHSLHPYPTMATFVIGAQSSGKSTLLNRLFGSRFAASNSRTTRGLYLSFRRTIIYDNDSEKKMNIILLDSEGLESTQRENSNSADSNGSIRFDALMALLSLTSSHVLLWNHCKELTSGVTKTFDTAFFNLGGNCFGTLNKRVVVHFALRDMENVGTSEERIRIQQSSVDTVRHSFSQVNEQKRTILGIVKDLDDLVSLNPDAVHPLSSAISSKKDCDLGYRGITLPWSSDVFGSEQIRDLRASILKSGIDCNTPMNFLITNLTTMVHSILTRSNFLDFQSRREIIQFHQVRVTATAAVARMIKDLDNCKTAYIRELDQNFLACISEGKPLNQTEEGFIENFTGNTQAIRQKATEALKQDCTGHDDKAIDAGVNILHSGYSAHIIELENDLMLHLRKAQKALTETQCVKKLEVAMAANSQGSFDDLWKDIESDLAPSLPNEKNIKKAVRTQFKLVLIQRPVNQVESLIANLPPLTSLTDCSLKYKETLYENMKIFNYPEIKDCQNQLDQVDKEILAIGLSIENENSVPFQITIERCLNWLKELAGSIISWEEHQKSKQCTFVIKGFLRSLQLYFVNIRSKLCQQVCQSIVAQHHMMYSFELEKLTSLKEDFKLQYELLRSNASDAEKAEKIGIRVCELADAYIEGKINQTISSMEAEVNYWATSEEATERAYEKSFTLLHDDNMKAYIENPSDFIEKLFHADLDGATVSTVQRRVEDLQSATVELMKKVKSVVMAWIENVQLEPVDEICEALFLRISRHDEKLFSKYGLCQRTQLYNLIGTLSAAEKDAVVLTLEGCLAERRKIAEQMQLLLPDLSFDVDSMVFKKAFQRASEICDFPNYLQSSFSDWFKDQMILAKNDSSIVLKKPVNVTSLLDAVAKELGSTGANVGLLICRPGTKVIDHVSFANTVLSSFETNFKICGLLNKPTESTKIDFNKIKLRLNEHLIYMRSKLRITAIGCMSTCPFCGAKCKLPHDHGGTHEVISHIIPALSGRLRTRITANRYETTLNICTSDMRILDYYDEKVIFPVQEFVKKYHKTWHPFNAELTDIQKQRERNLRMAWIALRPWCLEKNRELYPYLEDSTPTEWEQMYRRI